VKKDKRQWTAKKLREWLKQVDLIPPKGTLIAPLTDGDGHYFVTYPCSGKAKDLIVAVRRAGGFAKDSTYANSLGWESVEIDMHKTEIDRLENAQLSLRLGGDT
jgi:hypothetical protein